MNVRTGNLRATPVSLETLQQAFPDALSLFEETLLSNDDRPPLEVFDDHEEDPDASQLRRDAALRISKLIDPYIQSERNACLPGAMRELLAWQDATVMMKQFWEWESPTRHSHQAAEAFVLPSQTIPLNVPEVDPRLNIHMLLEYDLEDEDFEEIFKLSAVSELADDRVARANRAVKRVRQRSYAKSWLQDLAHVEDLSRTTGDEALAARRQLSHFQQALTPAVVIYSLGAGLDGPDSARQLEGGVVGGTMVTKYDMLNVGQVVKRLQTTPGDWEQFAACQTPEDMIALLDREITDSHNITQGLQHENRTVLQIIRGSLPYAQASQAIGRRLRGTHQA